MYPQRLWGSGAVHVVVAIGLLALVAALRLPGLSGYLGGLHNDHFPILVRASEILQGRLPLRDFVDYELRGVWSPEDPDVPLIGLTTSVENTRAHSAFERAGFRIVRQYEPGVFGLCHLMTLDLRK